MKPTVGSDKVLSRLFCVDSNWTQAGSQIHGYNISHNQLTLIRIIGSDEINSNNTCVCRVIQDGCISSIPYFNYHAHTEYVLCELHKPQILQNCVEGRDAARAFPSQMSYGLS